MADLKDSALMKIKAFRALALTIADLGDVISNKERLSLKRIADYAQKAVLHIPSARSASVITSVILPKIDQLAGKDIKTILKNAAKRQIQKLKDGGSQATVVAGEK